MMSSLQSAWQMLRPGALRAALRFCPICTKSRLIIRLDDNEIAIRCTSCRASVVSMSIAAVIRKRCPSLATLKIHELSSRGPLHHWLERKCPHLQCSEYFAGVPSGEYHNGVMCQDVQQMSLPDESLDLCTSTDVFEHVPDDQAGFRNICRVLKPGGFFIFTVPLCGEQTIERAHLLPSGGIEHLLPPEYHGDPIAESGRILAFRNYGNDITGKLKAAGFSDAHIEAPALPTYWGISRQVVVARK